MNNVCIFSHYKVVHDITAIHCGSNYSESAIWADTAIGLRLMVKTTTQSVRNMICKRCSFECDMGKYSTRPMNKVCAFRRTPYSLDEC